MGTPDFCILLSHFMLKWKSYEEEYHGNMYHTDRSIQHDGAEAAVENCGNP